MLDIGGFLTSMEFLGQLAALIASVLAVFVDGFIASLFGAV